MYISKYLTVALLLAGLFSLVQEAVAGDGHCAHCGRHACCQTICRLVREEKKVAVTCWGMQCEDFCVGGPSCPGCVHCEQVCDEADPNAPCSQPKQFVWKEWMPGCAKHVFTRKKLMKKTVTKKVPSFKWVVEDVCCHCEAKAVSAPTQPGEKVPPPPSTSATLK